MVLLTLPDSFTMVSTPIGSVEWGGLSKGVTCSQVSGSQRTSPSFFDRVMNKFTKYFRVLRYTYSSKKTDKPSTSFFDSVHVRFTEILGLRRK